MQSLVFLAQSIWPKWIKKTHTDNESNWEDVIPKVLQVTSHSLR